MPTFRENLVTRMTNIGTELASISDTDSIEFKNALYDELKNIKALLENPALDSVLDADQSPGKPFISQTKEVIT